MSSNLPKCRKVVRECAHCGAVYKKRMDRVTSPDYCSGKCRAAAHKDARRRYCKWCGGEFYPRTTQLAIGTGNYCSKRCAKRAEPVIPPRVPEEQKRRRIYEYQKRYMANNRDMYRQACKKWRAANKEKLRVEWRVKSARRRFRNGDYTAEDVNELIGLQRNKCAACNMLLGGDYHVDHIIPLVRGGSNKRENIQILCPACNLSKHSKDPLVFMQERGYLL